MVVLEDLATSVYRFALRLTSDVHAAEDLTQETLLRAWSRREQLREPRAARVWAFRIAVNLWRDQLRRSQSTVGASVPLQEECPARGPPPEQSVADQEELDRALAALALLPPRQREVLYLNACEQLTLTEIAEVLNIGVGAAKASLSLARKQLRERLTEPTETGRNTP